MCGGPEVLPLPPAAAACCYRLLLPPAAGARALRASGSGRIPAAGPCFVTRQPARPCCDTPSNLNLHSLSHPAACCPPPPLPACSCGYLLETSSHFQGTLAWAAPELLLGARCTEKIDIFSFGVVLWEMATRQLPQRGFLEPPKPSEDCPPVRAGAACPALHVRRRLSAAIQRV